MVFRWLGQTIHPVHIPVTWLFSTLPINFNWSIYPLLPINQRAPLCSHNQKKVSQKKSDYVITSEIHVSKDHRHDLYLVSSWSEDNPHVPVNKLFSWRTYNKWQKAYYNSSLNQVKKCLGVSYLCLHSLIIYLGCRAINLACFLSQIKPFHCGAHTQIDK